MKKGRYGRRWEEKVLVTKSKGSKLRPTRPGEELLKPKKVRGVDQTKLFQNKTHHHEPKHSKNRILQTHLRSIEFPIFDCSETIARKNFKCRPIEMALTIDLEGNYLKKKKTRDCIAYFYSHHLSCGQNRV